MNEKFCISIRISLRSVYKGPTDNKTALIQVMAWRQTAIIWTNADPVHRRTYAAPGRDATVYINTKATYIKTATKLNRHWITMGQNDELDRRGSGRALYNVCIFKRNDNICKENYRCINLLTTASKLFENIMSDQLTEYFGDLLSSTLSAYRKGYSCQHVILRLTEYWRQALDNGSAVGTVAMDLDLLWNSKLCWWQPSVLWKQMSWCFEKCFGKRC